MSAESRDADTGQTDATGAAEASPIQSGPASSEWFVLHSRPRCEKKASQSCLDLEVTHFFPLHERSHRRGNRSYSFDVPLFPGYLFACCDKEQRLAVLRTGYLVRTIEVIDQERLLTELQNVYLACSGGADLILYPQLKRGRQVRVLRGPLTGVYGRISKRKEAMRLVLNVTILGTAVATEMDMDDVELI